MWVAVVVLYLFYSALLSYAAWKDWSLLRFKSVQILALTGFFGLFLLLVNYLFLIFALPVLLVAIGLALRFMMFLVADWFETAHRFGTGIDRMTIEKTYDRAEKAEREKNFDEAIRMYAEEGRADPEDPEPWRRIAEIEVTRDRLAESIGPFRRALTMTADPEAKVTVTFRLADILARVDRTGEARELIDGVAREFRGTRYEAFAQERLRALG